MGVIRDDELVTYYSFYCMECKSRFTLDDYKNLIKNKLLHCKVCDDKRGDILIKTFFAPAKDDLWEEFFLWRMNEMKR